MEGKYIGNGPSLVKLRERAASRSSVTPNPAQSSKIINEALQDTGMLRQPHFLGDNKTVSKKRSTTKVTDVETNSSHRPEYVVENVPRKRRAKKLEFGQGGSIGQGKDKVINKGGSIVQEIDIAPTMWAIRRPVVGSKFTCQGMLQKVGKCKKRVSKGKNPSPAPCFLGMRQWEGKSKETWVWCCSNNATHVWNVCPYIIVMRPPRPPLEWPVAKGTNLTKEELASLTQAGFHIATVKEEELCESWLGSF